MWSGRLKQRLLFLVESDGLNPADAIMIGFAIIRQIVEIAILLVVPPLLILAYRYWAKHLRQVLPSWRTAFGLTSLLFTLTSWLCFVVPLGLTLASINIEFISLPLWERCVLFLVGGGIPLAFTFSGHSRIQAVSAAVLIGVLFRISIVHFS